VTFQTPSLRGNALVNWVNIFNADTRTGFKPLLGGALLRPLGGTPRPRQRIGFQTPSWRGTALPGRVYDGCCV